MKKVWLFVVLAAVPAAYGQANLKNPSALKEPFPKLDYIKKATIEP